MRRKPKTLWTGWVRVQPVTAGELPRMARALGLDPDLLKPTDKTICAQLTTFPARGWKDAHFKTQLSVRRQIQKVTAIEPVAVTVHVERVTLLVESFPFRLLEKLLEARKAVGADHDSERTAA